MNVYKKICLMSSFVVFFSNIYVFCDYKYKSVIMNDIGQVYIPCENSNEKVVFLTFDDGPSSTNTTKILKILKDNNVKGSFFVIGKNAKLNIDILKELYVEGMGIYPHSQCHAYNKIYKCEEDYFDDLEQCKKAINDSLNFKIPSNFVRMPGGSRSKVGNYNVVRNIKTRLREKGVSYIDWNVSSGDATSVQVSSSNILNNIILDGNKYKVSVVLMHDTYGKESTTESLQDVINYYKREGYIFKTLEEMTNSEYRYLVKCGVINAS